MQITFLEADRPLRKTFSHHGKTNYPNAYEFTSHTHEVTSSLQLQGHILTHALEGNCLLKGVLQHPLQQQPRAGSTDSDALTSWICLDADGLLGVEDADDFLNRLELHDISYVLQWSSSAFLEQDGKVDTRFNAHIFMLLDRPVSPHLLKLWLKKMNFEQFSDSLELTASNVALRWGLDITTCQNDKLLFIAPPQVKKPYTDTLQPHERIVHVERSQDAIAVDSLGLNDLDPEVVRKKEIEHINRLRGAKGMGKKRASTLEPKGSGIEFVANPSRAEITGKRQDRGFTYFNLNGGDSWAYFHPDDSYEYIYNFKGEPIYLTKELLPDYYYTRRREEGEEKAGGRMPVAFRGMQDGCVYNGFYDEEKDELELYMAKRPSDAILFLEQYGVFVEALPTFRLVHDPKDTGPRLDVENERVNQFTISALEQNANIDSRETPVIDRIIEHVVGSDNVQAFLNWFAFIVQEKTASGTGWVLHGVQGTGKGILINQIMRPILGYKNTAVVRTANFEDNYNGFLENALLVAVDEVDVAESRREKMIAADWKNYMTEPTISIRRMHTNVYEIVNRTNWIYSSNKRNPVPVEPTDRRFNVADCQEEPIRISAAEIEQITDELPALMYALLQMPVDHRQARTAAMTAAKKEMQALSETSVDQIANALIFGKAETLYSFVDSTNGITDIDKKLLAENYNSIVRAIVCDGKNRFTRHELRTIFEATVGKVPDTPAKFTKYLHHHGVRVGINRIGGQIERGSLAVLWRDSDDWFAEARRHYGVMKTVEEEKKEKPVTRISFTRKEQP